MTGDARRILWAQAIRAIAYGFGSVLLGSSLQARGWSPARVGLLLSSILVGAALATFVVGRFGERIGRRRLYGILFGGLALAGLAFGLTDRLWVLLPAALIGTLSTEVVESGPFTSLEQAMLPGAVSKRLGTRIFGAYNAVATISGSIGALAAGGPAILRSVWAGTPPDQRFFLVLVPIGLAGAILARSLTERVEAGRRGPEVARSLDRSRRPVSRLAALFAVDSFGGGFVLQSFIAYWLRLRFGASTEALGLIFFAIGLLQAGSFLMATRLADRVGLLNTMVLTHLPSNILLAAVPLAPNLPVAVALLFGRYALSQMDVPTRQAYVMALVDPDERVAAAAYTNSARYAVRPMGPVLAGLSQRMAGGLPFALAGAIKAAYDLALWSLFRKVPLATVAERGFELRKEAIP